MLAALINIGYDGISRAMNIGRRNPSRGSELCTVVERFSLEQSLAILGQATIAIGSNHSL